MTFEKFEKFLAVAVTVGNVISTIQFGDFLPYVTGAANAWLIHCFFFKRRD